MTKYTTEQIAVLLANRTPGEWRITYRAPDYGFDIGTEAKFNLKGYRCMMFSSEGTAEFVAAAPAIVAQQATRIKELETALRSLTDVGDGHYVGWRDHHSFNKYGPFCIYCNAEWDRHTSTPPDSHTQDCPLAIARTVLGGDA